VLQAGRYVPPYVEPAHDVEPDYRDYEREDDVLQEAREVQLAQDECRGILDDHPYREHGYYREKVLADARVLFPVMHVPYAAHEEERRGYHEERYEPAREARALLEHVTCYGLHLLIARPQGQDEHEQRAHVKRERRPFYARGLAEVAERVEHYVLKAKALEYQVRAYGYSYDLHPEPAEREDYEKYYPRKPEYQARERRIAQDLLYHVVALLQLLVLLD
jgi:hypothetical protein